MSEAVIAKTEGAALEAVRERITQAQMDANRRRLRAMWGLVSPALVVVGIFGIGPLIIILADIPQMNPGFRQHGSQFDYP